MFRNVFLLISIFCVVSCSAGSTKYMPVQDLSPRVSTLGFTISPPPGKDWYERHIDESLRYFKRTKGKNYVLTTEATEIIFDNHFRLRKDFIEYVKRQKGNLQQSTRYKNGIFDYNFELVMSSKCIRYIQAYDDYGNKKRGSYPYVRVYNKGFICQHPDSPDVGIDINYREESYPDENIPSYRKEGEHFLSSLNFYSTDRY